MQGLTVEAKKVIRRWARSDYYVYIRPMCGVYFGQDTKDVVWAVSVECRQVDFKQLRKDGADLSAVICELDLLVPRRSKGYVSAKPQGYAGWLAPRSDPQPRPNKSDPGEVENVKKKPRPDPNIPSPMREARPRRNRRAVKN